MSFEIRDHMLYQDGEQVEYVPTPNISSHLIDPEGVIMHHTAGTPEGSDSVNWLTNPKSGASAPVVVNHYGKVTQLAPLNARCWHAGYGSFNDQNPNDCTIGIEMCNPGRMEEVAPGIYGRDNMTATYNGEEWGVTYFEADWDKGHYIPFSIEALTVSGQIVKAINDYYGIDDTTTHQIVDPDRKVDPHPGFNLAQFQDMTGGTVKAPNVAPKDRIVTANMVSIGYAWPSFETQAAKIPPLAVLPRIRSGTYQNQISENHIDNQVWVLCAYEGKQVWVPEQWIQNMGYGS